MHIRVGFKIKGKTVADDRKSTIEFLARCKDIYLDYDLKFVINMNETPVWYDMPSGRTLEFAGAETVDIKTTGNEKNRFTTVVTVTTNGTVLFAYIIFGNLKRVPNEKKVKCPANVVLAVNESGSMDEDLMCDYLNKIIKPYISNASAMLIMDSFKGHTTVKL